MPPLLAHCDSAATALRAIAGRQTEQRAPRPAAAPTTKARARRPRWLPLAAMTGAATEGTGRRLAMTLSDSPTGDALTCTTWSVWPGAPASPTRAGGGL